jgi:hypothetical protein
MWLKYEQPSCACKSSTSEGAEDRAVEKSLTRPRVWALTLLVCVAACASPATKTSDAPIASDESPRFSTGGPDAEEFGASMSYPKGNPATFWRPRWQVGSFSHFDEIFRGRLIHKAPTPSRLVRVAEPSITWRGEGLDTR